MRNYLALVLAVPLTVAAFTGCTRKGADRQESREVVPSVATSYPQCGIESRPLNDYWGHFIDRRGAKRYNGVYPNCDIGFEVQDWKEDPEVTEITLYCGNNRKKLQTFKPDSPPKGPDVLPEGLDVIAKTIVRDYYQELLFGCEPKTPEER